MYALDIERAALKSLSKISRPYQDKIITAIEKLKNNPRPAGVKKLTGRDAWRIRVGEYRIIYEIYDKSLRVLILHIGPRGGVYRVV